MIALPPLRVSASGVPLTANLAHDRLVAMFTLQARLASPEAVDAGAALFEAGALVIAAAYPPATAATMISAVSTIALNAVAQMHKNKGAE